MKLIAEFEFQDSKSQNDRMVILFASPDTSQHFLCLGSQVHFPKHRTVYQHATPACILSSVLAGESDSEVKGSQRTAAVWADGTDGLGSLKCFRLCR